MTKAELHERLKSFNTGQFDDLFLRLDLSEEYIGPNGAPATVAKEVLRQVEQRHGADLSELEAAVRLILHLPPAPPPSAPTPPTPAPPAPTPVVVEARLDRRPRLLILAANPATTSKIQLEEEARQIERALGATDDERRYGVVIVRAVRRDELSRLLLEHRPKVVHFGGHGGPDGALMLEDAVGLAAPVAAKAAAAWFAALPQGDRPDCIVLNACYSREMARALAEPVKCVVGMAQAIDDESSIAFATGFYRGLARYEEDYPTAFALGCAEIDLLGMPDARVPRFSTREGDRVPEPRGGQVGDDEIGVALVPSERRTRGSGFESSGEKPVEDRPHLCNLYFGTNRQLKDPRRPADGFGHLRDNRLHYGQCRVVIPRTHRIGSTGSSRWARLWRGDDRIRLARIKVLGEEAFWGGVRLALDQVQPGARSAVVFVHGFNVSFEGAAIRAAQIGFDLKVPGVMAFYSWPSLGIIPGYLADIETVEHGAAFLAEFLRRMVVDSGAERVHVIAHSMGNRGLLLALRLLEGAAADGPIFDQVVLAAADLDAGIFMQGADLYRRAARRTTLYTTRRDRALKRAGQLRVGYSPRAGHCPPLTVAPGIDTVETRAFDLSQFGHGYIAEARAVLTDLHGLIVNGLPPDRRPTLEGAGPPPHWIIPE